MLKSRFLIWTLSLSAAALLLLWWLWNPLALRTGAPASSGASDSATPVSQASPTEVDSPGPPSNSDRARASPAGSASDRRRRNASALAPYGVDGLVIDPDYQPISQARIEIQAQSFEKVGDSGQPMEMRSRRDGSFYLRLAQPGNVKLKVSAEGYARRELEMSLTLPGLLQRVVVLSPADSLIEGQVINVFSREPIPGAVVEAVYQFSFEGAAREEHLQTQSDRQGYFRFGPLPAGSIRLTAARTGFFEDVQDLGLAQGESREAVLRLVPAETREFAVTDPDGQPVGGASVVRPDGWMIEADDQGRFRLPLIAELQILRMTISAQGYLLHSVKAPVAEVPEVIVLTPGPLLQGRVRDEWGQGIEGAEVTVLNDNQPQPGIDGQVFTDSDGRFSWALSQFEVAGLEIRRSGYVDRSHRFASRRPPAAPFEIELRRADAGLQVRLVRDGRPVERAYVHLRQLEGPDQGMSWKHVLADGAGETLLSDLSAGVYEVTAASPQREGNGFRIWRGQAKVTLPRNRLASVRVQLSPEQFVDIAEILPSSPPPSRSRFLPSQ